MIVASRGVNPTEVTDDFTAHVRRFHGCGGSAHLRRGASNQEEADTEEQKDEQVQIFDVPARLAFDLNGAARAAHVHRSGAGLGAQAPLHDEIIDQAKAWRRHRARRRR